MSGLLTGQHGQASGMDYTSQWTQPHGTAGSNAWQQFMQTPGMQQLGGMNPHIAALQGLTNFASNPSMSSLLGINPQVGAMTQAMGQALQGFGGGGAPGMSAGQYVPGAGGAEGGFMSPATPMAVGGGGSGGLLQTILSLLAG